MSLGPTATHGSGGSRQGGDPQPVGSEPPAKLELAASGGVPVKVPTAGPAISKRACTSIEPAEGLKLHVVPVPEHGPPQPAKIDPAAGVAVRLTVDPGKNSKLGAPLHTPF